MILKDKNQKLIACCNGVKGWEIGREKIFLPFQKNQKGKVRGLSHTCFPFGKIETEPYSEMPKHGYLRQVSCSSETSGAGESVQTIDFFPGNKSLRADMFENFPWQYLVVYRYKLLEKGFQFSCSITNKGKIAYTLPEIREPMPLSFGWHPYFRLPISQAILQAKEDSFVKELDNYRGTDRLPCFSNIELATSNSGTLKMSLSGFDSDYSWIYLWSEEPKGLTDDFVCVEPVYGDPETFGTEKGQFLDFGQTKEFAVKLTFEPLS